ncbi:hypothetical protein T12_3026 [Trichinella patagoniensis]|uniref:Uncharacterized protein n=1 Tax=Trichinella patagoniensis TaxID=990121 RepID=A0A0V1ABX9_9BILA|nr:hypothetical protein T12_3026 [Trichinella patagoniensis]
MFRVSFSFVCTLEFMAKLEIEKHAVINRQVSNVQSLCATIFLIPDLRYSPIDAHREITRTHLAECI